MTAEAAGERRFLIVGSCVSRDVFRLHENEPWNLVGYFARSSFASAFHRRPVKTPWHTKIGSAFQARMVRIDLEKSLARSLRASDFDVLVVDFIDERFPLVTLPDGSVATLSGELAGAGFDRTRERARLIASGSEEHFELWREGWTRFVEMLAGLGRLDRLLLNEVCWATTLTDGTTPDWAYRPEQIAAANHFLERLHRHAERDLSSEQVLRFDPDLFTASAEHRWGLTPFHYGDDYYAAAKDRLVAFSRRENAAVANIAIGASTREETSPEPRRITPSDEASDTREQWLGATFVASRSRANAAADRVGHEETPMTSAIVSTEPSDGPDVGASSTLFPPATDKDADQARKFILEGLIETKNFGDVPIGADLWSCGPCEIRNWNWLVHSFMPLDPLIATGEAELVNALVASWEARHRHRRIGEEFPWHDHATALRLDRLSRMAVSLPNSRHVDLAARHADLLLEEEFYSRHTNHGFDQAVALVLASYVFGEHSNAPRWREVGMARLADETRFAFTDEGVHVENSPGYHRGMIYNMLRARAVLHLVREKSQSDLDTLYDKALVFAAWMTRPDRLIVYLGDTATYRSDAPEELSDLPNYAMMEWASSGGRRGVAPREVAAVFPRSGYAVYRSRWDPWDGHVHIVLKNGLISSYHRQDDDLNVLVHGFGEDWLIDSGLYSHNETDPVRIYMRSPSAHNVPLLKGLPTRRTVAEENEPFITEVADPSARLSVVASTRMYKGARVTRRLSVFDADRFDLRDTIEAPAEIPRYWLFHTPRDKRITVSPGAARIRGKTMSLLIRTIPGAIPSAVHSGMDAPFPSAFSAKPHVWEKSNVVVFGPTTESALRLCFTFEPLP